MRYVAAKKSEIYGVKKLFTLFLEQESALNSAMIISLESGVLKKS